jgi:hypothetical protein
MVERFRNFYYLWCGGLGGAYFDGIESIFIGGFKFLPAHILDSNVNKARRYYFYMIRDMN